jgi:hypothetical protein
MKTPLRLLLSLIFIISSVCAKAAITITINSPMLTSVSNERLSIDVSINSLYSIDTLKATVGTKEALLVRNISTGRYNGTINLTGLPQGLLLLNIMAKDAMGNTQTKDQQFIYNIAPTVTVISPVKNASFLQSKIHIKATVNDPGRASCIGVVKYNGVSFSYVNSIDTLVDLAPGASSWSGKIEFKAIDDQSQTASSLVPVYIEESPFLKPFFTNTGEVIDFKGNRALILEKDNETDNLPHLKIVNVVTNTTEIINLGPKVYPTTFRDGILCEGGAALVLTYQKVNPTADSVFVWKNGTLTNIIHKPGRAATEEIKSENNYLMTERNGDLIITNLTNLTEAFYASGVTNGQNDISPQNNVAYSKTDGPLQKYDANTGINTTVVTGGHNVFPEIDGNNIAYLHYDLQNGPYSLHLNNGITDENLGTQTGLFKLYQLKDGYIVYRKPDNSNVAQLWLRTPAGADKQLTFLSSSLGIRKLGDDGRLMLTSSAGTLYTDSITPLKPVSSFLGTVYFNNNDFYLALGGSIFRYDIPSGPAAAITSISPTSAAKGQTVTITGEHFTGITGVTFGMVPAASYTVVSDTQITAVVAAGATGSIVVQLPAGNGSITGFTYLPPPKITSLSAVAGNEQRLITINGSNLTGTTAVTVGGIPVTSFTVVSSRAVSFKATPGASGTVKITTPYGEDTFTGFTYIPIPKISANGTTMLDGDHITLTASPNSATYTYKWYRNDAEITGATTAIFNATIAGSYTVRTFLNGAGLGWVSAPVNLTVSFSLPASNYKITNTSVTCRGANNGGINITTPTTTYNYNYTATLTGDNVNITRNFQGSLNINDLAAGTYNICFTIAAVPDYKQCFTSVITQPADLSVYTSVIKADNNVVLSLAGGDVYYISLNGKTTETRAGQVTLALKPGNNTISVNTDKACQGTVTKSINIEDFRAPYPNPFADGVNIDLGDDLVKNAAIRVYNSSSSKEVFNQKYTDRSGKINISLKDLAAGVYIVRLTVDNKETVYKVIKM